MHSCSPCSVCVSPSVIDQAESVMAPPPTPASAHPTRSLLQAAADTLQPMANQSSRSSSSTVGAPHWSCICSRSLQWLTQVLVAGERHGDHRRTRRYALSFSASISPPETRFDNEQLAVTFDEDALARLLAATTAGGDGPAPADDAAIASLERVVDPDAASTCAICLDDLKSSSSPASRLPRCLHTFHESCLLPWLRNCHGTCPTCRTPVVEAPVPPPDRPLPLSALLGPSWMRPAGWLSTAAGPWPVDEHAAGQSSLQAISPMTRHRGASSYFAHHDLASSDRGLAPYPEAPQFLSLRVSSNRSSPVSAARVPPHLFLIAHVDT